MLRLVRVNYDEWGALVDCDIEHWRPDAIASVWIHGRCCSRSQANYSKPSSPIREIARVTGTVAIRICPIPGRYKPALGRIAASSTCRVAGSQRRDPAGSARISLSILGIRSSKPGSRSPPVAGHYGLAALPPGRWRTVEFELLVPVLLHAIDQRHGLGFVQVKLAQRHVVVGLCMFSTR